MKIRLLSDLHLEFSGYHYEYIGEDILVLAGDIIDGNGVCILYRFLEHVPMGVKILYVPGNHEFYHTSIENGIARLNEICDEFSNLDVLFNKSHIHVSFEESKLINFFGGTMFSDMCAIGSNMNYATNCLADFRLTESNTVERHILRYVDFNREFDKFVIDEAENHHEVIYPGFTTLKVCISHFVPSHKCIHKDYIGNILNPYFAANNDERIEQTDLWLFGHTHKSFDKVIGKTRLVCNPRGYSAHYNLHPENKSFDPNLIIEV